MKSEHFCSDFLFFIMNTIYITTYQSPIGEIILGDFQNQLVLADWKFRKMRNTIDNRIKSFFTAEFEEKATPLLKKTQIQLEEYFAKKRNEFALPLRFAGTEFQQSVWNELLKIPYGKTESYLSIAKKINNEKAVRAIASANGANAISIIVPCHRVIGSNNELTGYAGGLPAKKFLLDLEK